MYVGTGHPALEENGLQRSDHKSVLKKEPKTVSVKPKKFIFTKWTITCFFFYKYSTESVHTQQIKVLNQVTACFSHINRVEAILNKGRIWEKTPNNLHILDGLSLMNVEIPDGSQ